MGTNYPGSLDAYSRPSASTPMNASGYEGHTVVDNLYDAVEAIETELGADPAGGAATVKARLDAAKSLNTKPYQWPATGYYYGTSMVGTAGALTVTADRLYYCPFLCPSTATLSSVVCNVTTNVAGNVRLGIYSNSYGASTGDVPGSLLVDAGTASTGTTGFKEVATTQQLSGDTLYWLAAVFDATPAVGGTTASSAPRPGVYTTGGAVTYGGCFQSHTYGALPSSAGTLTWQTSGTLIYLHVEL